MTQLFLYLLLNRAGTRTGRATWIYFGLWALLLIVNELLVHSLRVVQFSTSWPVFVWFALLSPLILLLNRLDRSGPTVEEASEAAGTLAAAKEAKIESTRSYRLGKWIGKWVGCRHELVRVVDILSKRIGRFSVGGWLSGALLVAVGVTSLVYHQSRSTNVVYLKELIESHMIEKAASGFLVSARKAGSGEVGDSEWETLHRALSDCMVREASMYVVSDDPYLRERANKNTPEILAARFLRNCCAIK